MVILDSNLIIYSAQTPFAHLRPLVKDPNNIVSAFTMLEVLGYPTLSMVDKLYFQSVFSVLEIKDISPDIVNQAILLRQMRKISPDDAIIAATALYFSVDLYTRNISDFDWIKGLKVLNPV
jgi:toxin FitB